MIGTSPEGKDTRPRKTGLRTEIQMGVIPPTALCLVCKEWRLCSEEWFCQVSSSLELDRTLLLLYQCFSSSPRRILSNWVTRYPLRGWVRDAFCCRSLCGTSWETCLPGLPSNISSYSYCSCQCSCRSCQKV